MSPRRSRTRRPARSMEAHVADLRRRTLRRRRARLSARSSTASWRGWAGTDGRAPTATCRPTISSCRPPARRRDSSSCSCGADSIRHADDPLFRPIDADDFRTNGEHASDFSNLRAERSGPDHLPAAAEHQADRSGDQRAVQRDVRGRVAQGADGQRRRADGTRRRESRGRAARTPPADISWTRRVGDAAGAGARRA